MDSDANKLACYGRLVVLIELVVNRNYPFVSLLFSSRGNRTVVDSLVGSFVLLTVVFKSSDGSGLMTPATSLFIAAMNSAWLYEYSTGRSPRTNSPPEGKKVACIHCMCIVQFVPSYNKEAIAEKNLGIWFVHTFFLFGSDITSMW